MPTVYGTSLIAIMIAGALTVHSPDDPFSGTWHLSPSRSHFTGTRVTIANAGADAWTFTYGTFSWTLKGDGKDTPMPFGGTQSLRTVSPREWTVTSKTNGKLVGVDHYTLSSDEKSATEVSEGTRESGEHVSDTTRMKRVGGTRGFGGVWETEAVTITSPGALKITGMTNGLTFEIPSERIQLLCTFDGKRQAIKGPRVTEGSTVSCKKTGDRAVRWESRYKDRLTSTDDWSVSADGKTLTDTGHGAGIKETTIAVYERS